MAYEVIYFAYVMTNFIAVLYHIDVDRYYEMENSAHAEFTRYYEMKSSAHAEFVRYYETEYPVYHITSNLYRVEFASIFSRIVYHNKSNISAHRYK